MWGLLICDVHGAEVLIKTVGLDEVTKHENVAGEGETAPGAVLAPPTGCLPGLTSVFIHLAFRHVPKTPCFTHHHSILSLDSSRACPAARLCVPMRKV